LNRSQRRRMNGTRWRFGRGQTFDEEGHEIAEAKRVGLVEAYMHGQRWARLIEEEREARRRGEHKARYYR
jgi:hypothetical protein